MTSKALSGAVPDIVLRPLSEDAVNAAAAHVRTVLGLGPEIGVVALRCTRKSQVFLVMANGVTQVIKRFSDADDYALELYACTLLGGVAPVVALQGEYENALLLAFEYLPFPYTCTRMSHVVRLAGALARLHCASLRFDRARGAVTSEYRLSAIPAVPTGFRDTDAALWQRLWGIVNQAMGPDHVPLALLDLKFEHLRTTAPDGPPLFIDLETLALGVPGVLDLLTLLVLAESAVGITDSGRKQILGAYVSASRAVGADWTAERLSAALGLARRAVSPRAAIQ